MTRNELVEIVGDVWHKEYENGVGDRISVAEAVINVVLEECAKVLIELAGSDKVHADGVEELMQIGSYDGLIAGANLLRRLKSAPSKAKP